MFLSLGLTAGALLNERGGGRWMFTLIGLVLFGAAAPYLAAGAAVRRLPARWAVAVGVAVCVFGVADAAMRTQAFYFPESDSDGAMALWLPIASLAAIPLTALICHPLIRFFSRSVE